MSHYCQIQRDLKGPASIIKGGVSWKRETIRQDVKRLTTELETSSQAPCGKKAERIKLNVTIKWAMYAVNVEPTILPLFDVALKIRRDISADSGKVKA